jgi:hypothetical protein
MVRVVSGESDFATASGKIIGISSFKDEIIPDDRTGICLVKFQTSPGGEFQIPEDYIPHLG